MIKISLHTCTSKVGIFITLLVTTLSFCVIALCLHAEEAIVYRDYNKGVMAFYETKPEQQIVDKEAKHFSVSPNGQFLIAYSARCLDDKECIARLYDLKNATVKTIQLPFGEWAWSWWSADSARICVNRSLRQKDRGPACKDEERFGCAANAILQIVFYDLERKDYHVEKEFAPGRYDLLSQYEKEKNYKQPSSGIVSPDGNWKLSWGDKKIEWDWVKPEVVVISLTNGAVRKAFEERSGDFTSGVRVSTHPWSKDSKRFVLTKIPGGFFRVIFKIGTEPIIYIVDIASLKWTKISKGTDGYWLPNVPREFKEIQ